MLLRAGILAALLAGAGEGLAGETRPELAFVHVEANVGGASGGHAALRVEDTVFHVQQADGGLFRLVRQGWDEFRHVYAGLQNRGLHVARVAVDAADRERVQDHLARIYVVQQAAFELSDRLALDLAWLEAWAAGAATPPLRSAGLLDPDRGGDLHAAELRERVAAQLGAGFLRAGIERLARAAEAFEPDGDLEALRETLQVREGFLALEQARGLAPDALLQRAGGPALELAAREIESLAGFARVQERAVLELLVSRRLDRGHALNLAIARWLAIRRSLASGRLELLDPLPDGTPPIPEEERAGPEATAKLAAEADAVLAEARAELLARGPLTEPAYNLVELAGALAAELERAARGGALREMPRHAIPERGRSLGPLRGSADPATVARAIDGAQRALARQRSALRARWGYDILRRNCITELVRLVNGSFADRADAVRALGGYIEPGDALGFVPFVFFDQVTERLRVIEVEHIPSHRQRELARILAADPGIARRLEESTVVTSSIYTPRRRDGAFLFFTDGSTWPRPLLGALNLGWALGAVAPGVAAAPFDRGARLRAAGSGVLFSVPELVFLNFRKGSFEYVEAR
jgi:hypothetical protein